MQSNWTADEVETDVRYVVSKLLIEACPDKVWRVLTDYACLTEKFSELKKVKVLSENGDHKVMEQEVRPLPPLPPISYVVEVREQYPRLLEWRGLTAYIKTNQGRFHLSPVDGGRNTMVTFAAWAEAAAIVPAVIIRHQLRTIMPKVLKTLKAHAEV